MCSKVGKFIMAVFMNIPGRAFHHSCPTYLDCSLYPLRLDYCGFWPFCSTGTKLSLCISLLLVRIYIIYQ